MFSNLVERKSLRDFSINNYGVPFKMAKYTYIYTRLGMLSAGINSFFYEIRIRLATAREREHKQEDR